MEYGLALAHRLREDEGYHRNGPFSYATYLKYMLKRGSYADEVAVWVISQMWGIRITIIDGRTLKETRYRHSEKLMNTDMVLIHTGAHYTGVRKYYIIIHTYIL